MKKILSSISLAFCTLSSMVLHGADKQNEQNEQNDLQQNLLKSSNKKKEKNNNEVEDQLKNQSVQIEYLRKALKKFKNKAKNEKWLGLNRVTDIVEKEATEREEQIDELTKQVDSLRQSLLNISERIMLRVEHKLLKGKNVFDDADDLFEETKHMNAEINKLRNSLQAYERRLQVAEEASKNLKKDSFFKVSNIIPGSFSLLAGAYATIQGRKINNRVKKKIGKKIIKK